MCTRMKLEHFLTPYTKINSKWIKDLKVRPETKPLRGKHRQNTRWHNQSKILYDPPPRAMEIKTKVNKWNLIKLKSFCTAKETIIQVKRQFSEWEKIRSKWNNWQRVNVQNIQAAHTTQCQKSKQRNQIVGKDLNRHFSKEDIQMANKHMKRFLTSLIVRAMQTKATRRYHLTPVRMAAIKKVYKQ